MKKFKVISTAACTLVLVSQLHFTQCSNIRQVPQQLTAASPRFSKPSSTRPISHSTGGVVRFPTHQAKAYAAALADLLRAIVFSNEFREGPSALHQLLAVLRPLVRAVGIVSEVPHKIRDDTTTTTTMTTTTTTMTTTTPTTAPSPQTITCPPIEKGSSRKKLMALFVPMSAAPLSSPTASPPSTVTLPKLFRKADSYIENR